MKHYKNLSELHRENGFDPPENPLFSIHQCKGTCSLGDREFTSDFYMIGFKKLKSGVILYGRTKYDHDCGSMMFVKPRQIIEMKNLEFDEDGFLIFIHEDFLNGHPLHQEIKKYHYFDYETNEALHVSPKEEMTIWDLYRKIENEYLNNQDEYSREIILANVDTLLRYAQRFYKRQFINRSEISGKTVSRFIDEMDKYVDNGFLTTKGLPSVHYMAEKLAISAGYLTDVLKQESGKTALEHIHIYLISEAKNRLKSEDRTVSEIAYTLGFDNLSYFTRLFKKEVGMTPVLFKKQSLN
ncbi:helix-turn-helix transcriptional regulator [Dyadobacter chenwenxiniae]|uniref:Helix-turn-helix transcriptional regulator n=1 Tax=Dyadobacter chenwenxiniae TaxID=2906456 RepID=A0A9X1TLR0_9BACT|nr:response regulator transcription factor [Dyadobacter chenwenxiniae]MCF0062638.1 helix-turn-helix transcriptional regulator [Dyadobacter chenwenxiniae]UON83618.1 helix-turn-helix transcriptional regulator [Dyadobacter chenwenxiniae]